MWTRWDIRIRRYFTKILKIFGYPGSTRFYDFFFPVWTVAWGGWRAAAPGLKPLRLPRAHADDNSSSFGSLNERAVSITCPQKNWNQNQNASFREIS